MSDLHQDRVEQLNRQVDALISEQRFDEALSLATQAWVLARELGENHPQYALSLYHLGWICMEHGEQDAEALFLHALQIRQSLPGDNSFLVSQSLNTLAYFYFRTRNLSKAEAVYHEVLRFAPAASREAAVTLNNLGMVRKLSGDFPQAAFYYQQAFETYRIVRGMTHADTNAALHAWLDILVRLGKLDNAEPFLLQMVKSLREAGLDSMDLAKAYKKLGEIYSDRGDWARSEENFRQSREIVKRDLGEDDLNYGVISSNLGLIYQSLGDHAKAIELISLALTITRANVPDDDTRLIAAINNLGMAHLLAKNFAEAEPLLLEALRRAEAAPKNAESIQAAKSLNALAVLYGQQDDKKRVEKAFYDSLELRRIHGENTPFYAVGLQNLAQWHQNQGNYDLAEELLTRAIDIMRSNLSEYNPVVASGLSILADIRAAAGRIDDALELMDQVCALHDFSIGNVFSFGSDRQRLEFLKTMTSDLHEYLSLVVAYRSTSPAAVHKALDLLLRRKTLTVESLAAQRDVILSGRRPELLPLFRELAAAKMDIAQKIFNGPGSGGVEAHRQALVPLIATRERLENELARNLPEIRLEQLLRAADSNAVAAALPEGSTLIEFARYDFFDFQPERLPARSVMPARYVAFVLLAGRPDDVQMVHLGDAERIDQLIADFRAAITGENEMEAAREMLPMALDEAGESEFALGSSLRTAIFDPLIPALGHRKRLIIAADGELARLPFEVLPTADGIRLIDTYAVSYLNCGRDILRFGAKPSNEPTEPIVAADPDFDLGVSSTSAEQDITWTGRASRDLNRNVRFDRLPGTRKEGERIAAMLGVKPWLDTAALEHRLKTCRSPRILHLATHGFFLEDQTKNSMRRNGEQNSIAARSGPLLDQISASNLENPLLRSGLALAGANGWLRGDTLPAEAEDGLLTAEDVSGLDLLDTELVVLSACETGLGQIHIGEGVFGLRRAFVQAGANTLVMSLWKVPDAQTQELMESFYQRILAGEGRADALRGAQLALRAKYPKPFYWAAFICQGDPAPLSNSLSFQTTHSYETP